MQYFLRHELFIIQYENQPFRNEYCADSVELTISSWLRSWSIWLISLLLNAIQSVYLTGNWFTENCWIVHNCCMSNAVRDRSVLMLYDLPLVLRFCHSTSDFQNTVIPYHLRPLLMYALSNVKIAGLMNSPTQQVFSHLCVSFFFEFCTIMLAYIWSDLLIFTKPCKAYSSTPTYFYRSIFYLLLFIRQFLLEALNFKKNLFCNRSMKIM